MRTEMRVSILALGLLVLAGCASERVILLPSADGRPGAVIVRDAQGEHLLAQPYAASARRQGENKTYQSSPAEVKERFAGALAAQPARPDSYILYFQEGANELTAESKAEFARLRTEIVGRAASEVMVIGHTDRVGSVQGNDALSIKRAEAVRALLVEAGIPNEKLEVAGRGEREPLVPTEDEVAEAKNRRVEISIR